jgi:hypothetical protein
MANFLNELLWRQTTPEFALLSGIPHPIASDKALRLHFFKAKDIDKSRDSLEGSDEV